MERKKYKFFVISDIHGEYDAMINGLNEAGYNQDDPEHFLVCAGDAFDRGPNSISIYNFFRQLPPNRVAIVKGNHDGFFQEYLEKGMDGEFVLFNILHNGLGATIKSFVGRYQLENQEESSATTINELEWCKNSILARNRGLLDWIKNLPLWFETENTVIVHAGLDPKLSNWKDTTEDYCTWDIEDAHKLVPSLTKTIIFGHYHTKLVKAQAEDAKLMTTRMDCARKYRYNDIKFTSFGNEGEYAPVAIPESRKIAIDGCTNLTHKVNVLVFEDFLVEGEPQENEGHQDEVRVESEDTSILTASTFPDHNHNTDYWDLFNPAHNHIYYRTM